MGRKLINYNRNIFNKIDNSNKAYWLGFIIADGYLNESRSEMRIKLGDLDGKEHLTKFIKFIEGNVEDLLKNETHNITQNTLWKVSLCGKQIKNDLVNLNVRQGKSMKEQIPPINKIYYKDLIRGLWDGDGFIRKTGTGIGLCSSKEVLRFVQNHFERELNIKPKKIYDHCHTWKIEYRNEEDVKKILIYLYENSETYLTRKYKLYKEIIHQ